MRTQHAPNPRRGELRALSQALKPLVSSGMYASMNEAILAQYSAETGAAEWHTFTDWRKAGRPVRKGEQGFPIWGTPRRLKAGDDQPAGDMAQLGALLGVQPEGPQFWPVAYLFHAGQVETTEAATLTATEPATA